VRRVRDFVEVRGTGAISLEAAREGCTVFGVDDLGLDDLDLKILNTLCRLYPGRPVGLTTLAASVHEDVETIEDVAEPFLMQAGLLQRTARGRVATTTAYSHLGMDGPPLQATNGQPTGILEVALFPAT
jgi:Holliday junction DNA helicase RuvB